MSAVAKAQKTKETARQEREIEIDRKARHESDGRYKHDIEAHYTLTQIHKVFTCGGQWTMGGAAAAGWSGGWRFRVS